MKKVKLILILINAFLINKSVSQTHEELYNKAGFENLAKQVVEVTIKSFSEQNPSVSITKWNTIKANIDYSSYKLSILNVLRTNYTLTEIEEIFLQNKSVEPINETGAFIFKPKKAIQDQLYSVSRVEGKKIMAQIFKAFEI